MSKKTDISKISRDALATRTYLDGEHKVRPLSVPIYQGTIFAADSADNHARIFQSDQPSFYQRFGHPNAVDLAAKIVALEGAESGLAFGSGMAAISTTLLSLLSQDAHLVIGKQIFDQTESFLSFLVDRYGARVSYVDTRDLAQVEAAIRPETTAIYVESPSNPHLQISDIRAISELAALRDLPVVVDSTFATPFGQNPIALGASLVLHSGTKLINGHMDVMCGFVVGRQKLIEPIRQLQKLHGGVLDPHAAFLASRGIKTLAVRAERIFSTALEVAEALQAAPNVTKLRYPLHRSHPDHALATSQMSGGGCVIVFSVVGGRNAARTFLDSLQFVQIASSLGGVETVIELPYDLDWVEKTRGAESETAGVDLGHVRLSIGLEPANEIIHDLLQALRIAEGG